MRKSPNFHYAMNALDGIQKLNLKKKRDTKIRDDNQKMALPLYPNRALNLNINLEETLEEYPNVYLWVHKDLLVNSKFFKELISNHQIIITNSGVYLNNRKYNPLAVLRIIEFLYFENCIDFGVVPINKIEGLFKPICSKSMINELNRNYGLPNKNSSYSFSDSESSSTVKSSVPVSNENDSDYRTIVVEITQTLKLSQKFSIPELSNICWDLLEYFISINSLWSIWDFAIKKNRSSVSKACEKFSVNNAKALIESPGFEYASYDCIYEFLRIDNLDIYESELYFGMIKWIEFGKNGTSYRSRRKITSESIWVSEDIFEDTKIISTRKIDPNGCHFQIGEYELLGPNIPSNKVVSRNNYIYQNHNHYIGYNSKHSGNENQLKYGSGYKDINEISRIITEPNLPIHDFKSSRLKCLEDLLPLIRFNSLEKYFLLNFVETEIDVMNTKVITSLLYEAYKYHAFSIESFNYRQLKRSEKVIKFNINDQSDQKIRFFANSNTKPENRDDDSYRIILDKAYKPTLKI
ncbi:BTB/POZ and MATH domain-containing protein 4 [Smittium culicis]|uniref:BTB/POZ and MATH domain-containing protein 4 n=1 Tax=Smittium culicis TaxID=133412 RepID=A0A1R1YLX6_9FUNG|nr:BTB/POZ and MATH domain-containing protein 4 [Smittium culicis]